MIPSAPPAARHGLPLRALDAVRYVFLLARLAYLAGLSRLREGSRGGRLANRILLQQVYFTAVEALPLTIFIAVAFGALTMIQASRRLPPLGLREVEEITGFLLFREIAPLCVALIVIARSANAMVVEIGNMKVNGEMRALELAAINIERFVVLPRLMAMAISLPLLAVAFCAACLWGGFRAASWSGLLESSFVLSRLESSFDLETLRNILLRSIVFGIAIACASCLHGLRVQVSPTEVPQQATRGVIACLTLCFTLNFIISLSRLGP